MGSLWLGFRIADCEFRIEDLGLGQAAGGWYPGLCIWDLGSGTWDFVFAIWDFVFAIWDFVFGIWDWGFWILGLET